MPNNVLNEGGNIKIYNNFSLNRTDNLEQFFTQNGKLETCYLYYAFLDWCSLQYVSWNTFEGVKLFWGQLYKALL